MNVDETPIEPSEPTAVLPVVAVVGRPNVGKSTLVNRILGRREAVVEDVPGVTRDRVRYLADWAGRDFVLVDTGGWDLRATGRAKAITEQARAAVDLADVVLFVVDATVGAIDADEDVAAILRRGKVPVILVANKVDNASQEAEAAALWSLGLDEPMPVSGLHGRGSGDLLERVIGALPAQRDQEEDPAEIHRVALVGRPNVGKSSLLNALARHDRVVVDSQAGTTVDPVDEIVSIGGVPWQLVDTAGIRRRVKEASGTEWYGVQRTQRALERSDAAVLMIDAAETVSEQDVRIANLVVDAGKALVVAVNKWDLVDDERRGELEREIERELGHVSWAPRVNISAATGRHVDRLAPALDRALTNWRRRIGTGVLNQLLAEIAGAHPHPVRGGRQPRILFGTQPRTGPPTFVLFATRFLESGYRRFIERRLRETYDFTGTPIVVEQRLRAKRTPRS